MNKKATIYRIVIPGKHVCPYGIKSLYLLKKHGYEVEDNHLKTEEETKKYKEENGFVDTPRIFIDGKHIGNDDDLKRFLGYHVPTEDETTYKPVIAIFSVALLLSIMLNFLLAGYSLNWMIIPNFVAFAMILFAVQKLQDLEAFSTMFLGYDLLAQKYVPYAYFFPFGELFAGLLMLAGFLSKVSIPLAFFIGTVGAVSICKAVYIDKRELKCACVGGSSKVPLGFISLLEYLMMVGMAVWMFVLII